MMTPIPAAVLGCEFGAAAGFWMLLSVVKIPVFKRLGIA